MAIIEIEIQRDLSTEHSMLSITQLIKPGSTTSTLIQPLGLTQAGATFCGLTC